MLAAPDRGVEPAVARRPAACGCSPRRRPAIERRELALELLQPPLARREAGAHDARAARATAPRRGGRASRRGRGSRRTPAGRRRMCTRRLEPLHPRARRGAQAIVAADRSGRRTRPSRATTSSAAADGVGARTSATKSAMVTSVSWPTAEITGTGDARDRARDDFLVERPEIFDRAAAAADDDDVDARHAADRPQRRARSPAPRPRPARAPGGSRGARWRSAAAAP